MTLEDQPVESDLLVDTLVALFLDSYMATPRQRRIGEVRQAGPVSCVHYNYYWGGRHIQADNFFVLAGTELFTAIQAIRDYRPAAENQIFVPHLDPAVPEIMGRFGFENKGQNILMERLLTESDRHLEPAVPVHPVSTPEDVRIYNNIFGGSLALRTDALHGPFRFYYILDGRTPAAQGRTWRCRPTITWESHVYTDPNFQRRGYGKAIMQQIIRDNASVGVTSSTLLATEAGRRLYKRLGYIDRITFGCYKWREVKE